MPGESWTAYERPGELIITAEILNHDTATFKALSRQVSTIQGLLTIFGCMIEC